jgi:hypothetical protein
MDTVGRHPIPQLLGVLNRQAGKILVRLAAGDLPEVFPELLLRVRAGNIIGGSPVHITNVTGVAAVTAAKILGGTLQHKHSRAGPSRRNGGAEPRIAAANNQHVERLRESVHSHLNPSVQRRGSFLSSIGMAEEHTNICA